MVGRGASSEPEGGRQNPSGGYQILPQGANTCGEGVEGDIPEGCHDYSTWRQSSIRGGECHPSPWTAFVLMTPKTSQHAQFCVSKR